MKLKKIITGLAIGTLLGGVLKFFFNSSSGKKNREKFLKISKKISLELVEKSGKIAALTKKEYFLIVDNVIKKHAKTDLLEAEAWIEIAEELKKRWQDISREIKDKNKN